ncbi:MAG TPA: hypothetical protein VIP77_04775 [Jiangellaceae bacterium]
MSENRICWVGTCTVPAHPAHDPCCSSHGQSLCCEHYRRFHFVETACGHEEPDSPQRTDRVTFDGREIIVAYEPALRLPGMVLGGQTDHPTIVLRVWDERVFLHELLHVALDRRLIAYHDGPEWESLDLTLTSPREAIVAEVSAALSDMGWRWAT